MHATWEKNGSTEKWNWSEDCASQSSAQQAKIIGVGGEINKTCSSHVLAFLLCFQCLVAIGNLFFLFLLLASVQSFFTFESCFYLVCIDYYFILYDKAAKNSYKWPAFIFRNEQIFKVQSYLVPRRQMTQTYWIFLKSSSLQRDTNWATYTPRNMQTMNIAYLATKWEKRNKLTMIECWIRILTAINCDDNALYLFTFFGWHINWISI